MTALALVLAVVLVALLVAGMLGRIDGSLGEPTTSSSYVPLPDDRLTPADLESLRLDTAFRGYRMTQVDEVVGRLSAEIETLGRMVQERGAPMPAQAGRAHGSGAVIPSPSHEGAADPPSSAPAGDPS